MMHILDAYNSIINHPIFCDVNFLNAIRFGGVVLMAEAGYITYLTGFNKKRFSCVTKVMIGLAALLGTEAYEAYGFDSSSYNDFLVSYVGGLLTVPVLSAVIPFARDRIKSILGVKEDEDDRHK